MIIDTLTSDPAVSQELGRRIALTEYRRVHPSRWTPGAIWNRLFERPHVKPTRAHA